MADYWKSQPKKFCQYCKCWIADNKPSIEFHERGKNHQQNVSAKIEQIKKNSIDKAKKEKKMSKEFAAMEEAAMKAYEEDIKRLKGEADRESEVGGARHSATYMTVKEDNSRHTRIEKPAKAKARAKKSAVTAQHDSKIESDGWVQGATDNGHIYYYSTTTGESQWEKPGGFQDQTESTAQTKTESAWMEAVSPEGYMYYYNTETGESKWEKPSVFSSKERSPSEKKVELEGQLTVQPKSPSGKEASNSKRLSAPKISFRKGNQSAAHLQGNDENKSNVEDLQDIVKDKGNVDSVVATEKKEPPAKKPRKAKPYGDWEQIQEPEDPYENVDFQLPQKPILGSSSSEVPPEPKPIIKERTITSLGDESCLGAIFKKRKKENGNPRSLRQRGKDD